MSASLREARLLRPTSQHLEDELRSQLQDAAIVCRSRPQVRICSRTGRIAGRIVSPRVASQSAVGLTEGAVVGCRSGVPAQPRVFNVVEHVESFGAELEAHALRDGEMLEQAPYRSLSVADSSGSSSACRRRSDLLEPQRPMDCKVKVRSLRSQSWARSILDHRSRRDKTATSPS